MWVVNCWHLGFLRSPWVLLFGHGVTVICPILRLHLLPRKAAAYLSSTPRRTIGKSKAWLPESFLPMLVGFSHARPASWQLAPQSTRFEKSEARWLAQKYRDKLGIAVNMTVSSIAFCFRCEQFRFVGQGGKRISFLGSPIPTNRIITKIAINSLLICKIPTFSSLFSSLFLSSLP